MRRTPKASIGVLNFFVFITLGCWAVWGILDKKALSSSDNVGVFVRLYTMSLWQWPLFLLFMLLEQPGFHISRELWFWSGCAAVARAVSFSAYFLGMSLADASLVLGITAAYPIVTQLLAVSWLHEPLVASRMYGAIAIVIGLFGIGGSHKPPEHASSLKHAIVLWTTIVVATCGWGLWGIFDKFAVQTSSVYETWLAETSWEVGLILVFGLLWLIFRFPVELKNKPAWRFVFLSSLCLAVGKLSYLSALKMSSVSYVITITACYPVIMYGLAVAFLREKFDRMRLLGIAFVVAGGVAVQLTSGY